MSATVCTQLLVKPCLDLLFHGSDKALESKDHGNIESRLDDIVESALVHPEIHATLTHDVKLDKERPEYHRVTIVKSPDGSYLATTTGVQQSSRLMSLRDAEGYLVLPQASDEKPTARTGEIFPVLVIGNAGNVKKIAIRDSVHLKQSKTGNSASSFRVAVVEVLSEGMISLSSLDSVSDRIKSALSGSRSGSAEIVSKKTFSASPADLYPFAVDSNNADLVVISCTAFPGSFKFHLDVSLSLREKLTKIADGMALQARRGAAGQDPAAALFEIVIGYAPDHQGAMIVCLPERGLDDALAQIRGLLKHGLNLSRGNSQDHHHTHKHHGHGRHHKHEKGKNEYTVASGSV